MAAPAEKVYLNIRNGDDPESYVKGKFHPVHLGDVLNGRYVVFRKLGSGGQATVWLARDKDAPKRTYVAVKVFSARSSGPEIRLDKLLKPAVEHPGSKNVEIAIDSFIIEGPNGQHFCKILEPLGNALSAVLDTAFEARAKLNEPESWLGRVLEGDPWSGKLAKKACRQILLGLNCLHSQDVAHRDIHTRNVCLALDYDISLLTENEIQRAVWCEDNVVEDNCIGNSGDPSKEEELKVEEGHEAHKEEEAKEEGDGAPKAETSENNDDESDDSSDDESTASDIAYREEMRLAALEEKRKLDELWKAFDPGNILADPLSLDWQKANITKSRESIDLIRRRDAQPLQPTEIQYMVLPTPLDDRETVTWNESSRVVLVDLGMACPFNECEQYPIKTVNDFQPPEALLNIPATYKADIFSLGLLFWEIVMLRRLVEARLSMNPDPKRTNNRLLRDLVHRLGVLSPELRAQWADATEFVDDEGKALDMQEADGEEYDSESFEYGDIWYQARLRQPLDMPDKDLELFMDMVQGMLRFEPERRPTTSELLQHEWFRDL